MSLIVVIAVDIKAKEYCAEESCYYDSCGLETKNFYAKIFPGANFLQNFRIDGDKYKYQSGYVFSGSLGYRWCKGLSLEGE